MKRTRSRIDLSVEAKNRNFFQVSSLANDCHFFSRHKFFAVYFRMKSVDLDYAMVKIKKAEREVLRRNKKFKAIRAKELSIDNLNSLARIHKMQSPSQKQIIVIPEN